MQTIEKNLEYCPYLEETAARLKKWLDERAPIVLASFQVPSKTLEEFRASHPAGPCEFPELEERAIFWDRYLSEKRAIFDDSVPSAYLSEMDQGLYGGMVGAKPHFIYDPETGWISSMVMPFMNEWAEFPHLRLDDDAEWFCLFKKQLAIFADGASGKFGLSHFILINGINFLFELFGATRAYVEMLEHPEQVRLVLDFAFELNKKVQAFFFENAPFVCGGTCSNMAQWLPGRIVSESVDPFHMASTACFDEWGRGVLERIFSEFDGGVVHIHGNGRHLLDAIRDVRGLKAVYLGDDRGYPLAFEVLPQLRRQLGDMPLVCSVPYESFRDALRNRELTGGVLYNVRQTPGEKEANTLMDAVRAYQP